MNLDKIVAHKKAEKKVFNHLLKHYHKEQCKQFKIESDHFWNLWSKYRDENKDKINLVFSEKHSSRKKRSNTFQR